MLKPQKPRAINFATASHEELDQYDMEMLVFGSPELTPILRGHLLIERTIETLIAKKLANPMKLFDNHRVTFEMKVDLADAMGLLSPAYVGAAKALNKIRNSYAHREDYKISVEELNSLKIKWEPTQKRAFAAAVTPAGHLKLPHFWPVKLPQAGQWNYQSSVVLCARRAAASLSR